MAPASCMQVENTTVHGVPSLSPSLALVHQKSVEVTELVCGDSDVQMCQKSCALEQLEKRMEQLMFLLAHEDSQALQKNNESETLRACVVSLKSRLPFVLEQTKQWVALELDPESIGSLQPRASHAASVSNLRSTLAIFRADQYLDRIQEAMDIAVESHNNHVDKHLRTVLDGLDIAAFPAAFQKDGLAFRISPWVPAALCFDLPLGQSARASFPGDDGCGQRRLAIDLDVEPVVEFRADDQLSAQYAHQAARACSIEILECKHFVTRGRQYHSLPPQQSRMLLGGDSADGEATIRLLVSPLTGGIGNRSMNIVGTDGDNTNKKRQVWGCDDIVKSLHIQEARA